MKLIALSLLVMISGAAPALAVETVTLRPLEIDLRRLYPTLDPSWGRIETGEFRRNGARYRPQAAILAAPFVGASRRARGRARSAAALPRRADGVFLLRRGRVEVRQRLVGAAGVPALPEKGLLRYPNAYPHTEALYLSDGGGVERFFLLTDRSAPTRFATSLRVTGGRLKAASNRLAVYGPNGRPEVSFAPPRVLDAAGRTRPATWTLRGGAKGRYLVELAFDPSGLIYPVLVR